ncbi:MAG TPA: MFS transporter [Candidatus Paenibacillus intestinavium]|nr:MFS transporter [Candidatus Paenibacillus intestinavium]
MAGVFIFLLSSIFYFGVASIALLFIIRIIHGGSYGVAATSTSALATDIIPESRKGEGIGYFSMFMSVAMVVGPALGIMVWKKISFKNLIDKNALPISLAGFILAISYSSLTLYITSYTKELDQENSAGLFFIVFALTIIISRPFIGKMFDRLGENFLAYPGLICFASGMIILSQETSSTVLLLSAVIMGLGYGAILPCFQTIAIQSVPAERRGLATATFFLLFDAGYGVGSYLMGVIATHSNYRVMYFSAGVLALISLFIYYLMHHRQTDKSNKNMNSAILPKTS